MLKLINDILDYSKIESGRLDMENTVGARTAERGVEAADDILRPPGSEVLPHFGISYDSEMKVIAIIQDPVSPDHALFSAMSGCCVYNASHHRLYFPIFPVLVSRPSIIFPNIFYFQNGNKVYTFIE